MKAVVLSNYGQANVLRVTNIPNPTLEPDEFLVKIRYAGINYAEILSRQGLYSWAPKTPYIMGMEACGEIVKLGSDVENVEIGTRVIVGGQSGTYAEYTAVNRDFLLRPPNYLTWEECAGFGVAFFTAWVAMHEVARVRRGEIALIQAGAGGVGSAAIQLAKAHGMKVFATCSPGKQEIVEKLGATYLPYESFDEELKNSRPDYILESIGGDVFKRSFRLLNGLGRCVTIGGTAIKAKRRNPISLYKAYKQLPMAKMQNVLHHSKGFMGLHVGYLLKDHLRLRPMWDDMLKVCETNQLKPIVEKEAIFPLSRVSDAHDFISERKNRGKVLLDPSK